MSNTHVGDLVSDPNHHQTLLVNCPETGQQKSRPCPARCEIGSTRKLDHLQVIRTAVITAAEEGGFIAHDPSTGTTTQGDSVEEASANLHEAVQLLLEAFPEKNTS